MQKGEVQNSGAVWFIGSLLVSFVDYGLEPGDEESSGTHAAGVPPKVELPCSFWLLCLVFFVCL